MTRQSRVRAVAIQPYLCSHCGLYHVGSLERNRFQYKKPRVKRV